MRKRGGKKAFGVKGIGGLMTWDCESTGLRGARWASVWGKLEAEAYGSLV